MLPTTTRTSTSPTRTATSPRSPTRTGTPANSTPSRAGTPPTQTPVTQGAATVYRSNAATRPAPLTPFEIIQIEDSRPSKTVAIESRQVKGKLWAVHKIERGPGSLIYREEHFYPHNENNLSMQASPTGLAKRIRYFTETAVDQVVTVIYPSGKSWHGIFYRDQTRGPEVVDDRGTPDPTIKDAGLVLPPSFHRSQRLVRPLTKNSFASENSRDVLTPQAIISLESPKKEYRLGKPVSGGKGVVVQTYLSYLPDNIELSNVIIKEKTYVSGSTKKYFHPGTKEHEKYYEVHSLKCHDKWVHDFTYPNGARKRFDSEGNMLNHWHASDLPVSPRNPFYVAVRTHFTQERGAQVMTLHEVQSHLTSFLNSVINPDSKRDYLAEAIRGNSPALVQFYLERGVDSKTPEVRRAIRASLEAKIHNIDVFQILAEKYASEIISEPDTRPYDERMPEEIRCFTQVMKDCKDIPGFAAPPRYLPDQVLIGKSDSFEAPPRYEKPPLGLPNHPGSAETNVSDPELLPKLTMEKQAGSKTTPAPPMFRPNLPAQVPMGKSNSIEAPPRYEEAPPTQAKTTQAPTAPVAPASNPQASDPQRPRRGFIRRLFSRSQN